MADRLLVPYDIPLRTLDAIGSPSPISRKTSAGKRPQLAPAKASGPHGLVVEKGAHLLGVAKVLWLLTLSLTPGCQGGQLVGGLCFVH